MIQTLTIPISSSVNPYSSYTSRSAFGVPIGRGDLALVYGFLLARDRRGELAAQIQHSFHQRDHTVVARDVGGVSEVNGAYGKLEKYGRLPEALDWIGVKRRITGDNWNLLNDRLCNQ